MSHKKQGNERRERPVWPRATQYKQAVKEWNRYRCRPVGRQGRARDRY